MRYFTIPVLALLASAEVHGAALRGLVSAPNSDPFSLLDYGDFTCTTSSVGVVVDAACSLPGGSLDIAILNKDTVEDPNLGPTGGVNYGYIFTGTLTNSQGGVHGAEDLIILKCMSDDLGTIPPYVTNEHYVASLASLELSVGASGNLEVSSATLDMKTIGSKTGSVDLLGVPCTGYDGTFRKIKNT